jgi:hypothetical protein
MVNQISTIFHQPYTDTNMKLEGKLEAMARIVSCKKHASVGLIASLSI